MIDELGGHNDGFDGVTPADVVEAIVRQAHKANGDFPADEFRSIVDDRDQYRLDNWIPLYATLWRTVRKLSPRSIVEIGVRAGYSSWVMRQACPEATVHGFDLDCDRHGGYAGAFHHAEIINPDRFTLTIADSQSLEYIDGDHSRKGCLSDMRLAERSGAKTLLIDDYANFAEIREAVAEFVAGRDLRGEFIPCQTGLYLLPLPANG